MTDNTRTKRLTEEEAWERWWETARDWSWRTDTGSYWLNDAQMHRVHDQGWAARQPEIDELREALKQCVKALRFQSSADARDALAAARGVLEQAPEAPEEREVYGS